MGGDIDPRLNPFRFISLQRQQTSPRKLLPHPHIPDTTTMPRSRALLQAVLLALLLAGSAGVLARQSGAAPPARDRHAQHEDLPNSVRRVERETGGEVLRAEPMQRDGREVYRFKVLTADGRVRVMQDDPQARRADPADRRDGNAGPPPGSKGNNGNGSKQQKRPSRDPDGEPPQF
jgi:hypothetical protein